MDKKTVAVIADGLRYTASAPNPNTPGHWKGFGGRKFTVRFFNGENFKTDNLFWDYSYKGDGPDTGEILPGWENEVKEARKCRWEEHSGQRFFMPW